MNNPESQDESVVRESATADRDAVTAAVAGDVPTRSRRRRRSGSRSGFGLFSKGDSKAGGSRSSARGRSRGRGHSRRRNTERIIFISCLVLSIGIAAGIGFLLGKRSASKAELTDLPHQLEEVVPSSESEALVDSGFNELGEGNSRRAFLDFQKAQEGQQSLPGIDYLVGYSALQAGEVSLAKDSLQHAIMKKEMEDESKVLLALIALSESEKTKNDSKQITDPLVTAESELRHYATTHPMSAQIYSKWAEIHRQRGSYRTAANFYHKAFLRADPDDNLSLLAAKETLTQLQNQPAKEATSLATITAMNGEAALGAALACLQNKSPSDAVLFLERAKEYFSPKIFREIMKDNAFNEYRSDAKLSKFLESACPQPSKP